MTVKPGEAAALLDAFGLDAVCDCIADGVSMRDTAAKAGVSQSSLILWLSVDAERSARVRETRQAAALQWDEMAEAVLIAATDTVGVAKARELAHHYRWRASKIAPRDYGDRIAVEHGGNVDLRVMPDEQLRLELADLLAKATPALAADGAGAEGPASTAGLLSGPGAASA